MQSIDHVFIPGQGSAVFWYNLFPNGEGDYRTRHAACPVLVGNKWGESACLLPPGPPVEYTKKPSSLPLYYYHEVFEESLLPAGLS